MTPLAKRLHADGFSVSYPYIEGYGTLRRAGDIPTKWQDWNTRVIQLFDELKDSYENVFVGGCALGRSWPYI